MDITDRLQQDDQCKTDVTNYLTIFFSLKLNKFRMLSNRAVSNSLEVYFSALRDLQKCLFMINHFKHKAFRHVEC